MADLIQNFANYPVATLLILGILLILGGITRGNIKLIIVKVPPINRKQSLYLLLFGSLLIIAAVLIAIKPWQKNHAPVAHDDKETGSVGDTIVISALVNDTDVDDDDLVLEIIDNSKAGVSSSENEIQYIAKTVGSEEIRYRVCDKAGGSDTAKVTITVYPEPLKYETIKGELHDIFGKPMKGNYKAEIDNKICQQPIKDINFSDDGIFELEDVQEKKGCNIFIEKTKAVEFNWDLNDRTYSVTYDPIDSIQIFFCKGYNKSQKEPIGIFTDRFNIKLDTLEEYKEDSLKYGILNFQVIFFGSNKGEFSKSTIKRVLDCKIVQKDRDKIAYSFPVISGTSSSGWRSNFNKKLLKGEYELELRGKGIEEPKLYYEFEIK